MHCIWWIISRHDFAQRLSVLCYSWRKFRPTFRLEVESWQIFWDYYCQWENCSQKWSTFKTWRIWSLHSFLARFTIRIKVTIIQRIFLSHIGNGLTNLFHILIPDFLLKIPPEFYGSQSGRYPPSSPFSASSSCSSPWFWSLEQYLHQFSQSQVCILIN